MAIENPSGVLSDFYTPLDVAVAELMRRRKSPTLHQQVREELKLTPELEILNERPHLVMFRQVLTPLTETLLFFEAAKKHKLNPLVIEYYGDKFVSTGNQFKRGLGKMPIFQFTDKTGQDIFINKTVVDFNKHVGNPLASVTTTHGQSLIDFHHQLFFKTLDIKPIVISRDGTAWFKQFNSSSEYYEHFMKIFIRDAILFETFVTNEAEQEFFTTTVNPAIALCENKFKHSPLISIIESDYCSSDSKMSDYYPTRVGEILQEKGYS